MMLYMTNVLKEAMEEVARLPQATQERIGAKLIAHLDKLRRLRASLEKGIGSLNRGEGRQLEVEDVIRRARTRHGKA